MPPLTNPLERAGARTRDAHGSYPYAPHTEGCRAAEQPRGWWEEAAGFKLALYTKDHSTVIQL